MAQCPPQKKILLTIRRRSKGHGCTTPFSSTKKVKKRKEKRERREGKQYKKIISVQPHHSQKKYIFFSGMFFNDKPRNFLRCTRTCVNLSLGLTNPDVSILEGNCLELFKWFDAIDEAIFSRRSSSIPAT